MWRFIHRGTFCLGVAMLCLSVIGVFSDDMPEGLTIVSFILAWIFAWFSHTTRPAAGPGVPPNANRGFGIIEVDRDRCVPEHPPTHSD